MKITTPVLALLSLSFLSCEVKLRSESENISQVNTTLGLGALQVDVNKYENSKLVCDPFDPAPGPITYEQGIKASLHYREAGMPRMFSALDYILFARKSDTNLFLTDMNVPTRAFTEGFSTPNGNTLKTDAGDKLIEYFALKMSTNLVLTPEDEEGEYEIAVLADDGFNLVIKSGDGDDADETVISNDGDHPTKMGCSNRTIRFRRNAMLAVEAQYYQGPREHISNVLMWRKSTTAGLDPSCNQLGNDMYFDSNHGSTPRPAYLNLQARGWKVLKPGNFMVSKNNEDYNPCVQGTNPIISNFREGEIIQQRVDFHWETDIPATSQIQLTNMTTGVITTTTADNQLRTAHEVVLSGLQPNTTYKAQAISVSADLGRSVSSELIFQTQ